MARFLEKLWAALESLAGFRKQAQTLPEALERVKWIGENVSPLDVRVKKINELLTQQWLVANRLYSDVQFANDLLAPLLGVYGDRIYSLEQIEELTGRRKKP